MITIFLINSKLETTKLYQKVKKAYSKKRTERQKNKTDICLSLIHI